ncbi:hypothetical protein FDUTEX481_03895 [Tolypothrix sp. PCC 7601]|nr:hypothetical protein FDUTEX481_03895 [Tolypothrix sp. PCC 7601]
MVFPKLRKIDYNLQTLTILSNSPFPIQGFSTTTTTEPIYQQGNCGSNLA